VRVSTIIQKQQQKKESIKFASKVEEIRGVVVILHFALFNISLTNWLQE